MGSVASIEGSRGSCSLEPQVDGPHHFIWAAGGGRRPNGATLLKRGLLRRAGWRVLSVPHWEWEACAGAAEQQAYLRRRLAEPPGPACLAARSNA